MKTPPPDLVDANLLVDVATHHAQWFDWSMAQLEKSADERGAAINPVIYAELCGGYETQEEMEEALAPDLIRLELPYAAAFLASRAYQTYRRRGGTKTSPLPDFYIGAHAQVSGMRLLTRDVKRFRTYFPGVELIHPPEEMLAGLADA